MKLKHDKLLSNFALKYNLRHYTPDTPAGLFGWQGIVPCKVRKMSTTMVGRCRLTPGFHS